MTAILGPVPCVACRKPVVIDRVGSEVRVLERRGRTFREHRCPKPKVKP